MNHEFFMSEDDVQPSAFVQWLADQVGEGKRFESYRDMARKTGVSSTSLHRIRSGDQPTLAMFKKFSDALKVPLDDLQRMAGILPTSPDLTPDEAKRQLRIRQFTSVFARLPEEDQQEIMTLAMIAAGLSEKNRALLFSMAQTMMSQEAP